MGAQALLTGLARNVAYELRRPPGGGGGRFGRGRGWLRRASGLSTSGLATAVARTAFDIASKMPVDVDDLRAALRMTIGPQAVEKTDGPPRGGTN